MARSIEEIVGKLERKRMIPGTRPGESEAVRYVSLDQGEDPGNAYQAVIMKVEPPLMKSGGVMLDGCIITVPDGTRFYPLVLNGDLDGWRRQIEQGAAELELLTGHIAHDRFYLSNGQVYPITECAVEFD